MPADRSPYIPLLFLAIDWAKVAGVPKELVLRRLCDWAVAGAFPKNSFITATGTEISPFDLYMSFRAMAEDNPLFGRGIDLGGWTIYNSNERWGIHVLEKALVTAANVFAFCERTKTLAPPVLLSGFWRFLARWDQTKHIAPPECPDAEEYAIRHFAHDSAVGSMNYLRTMLAGLQGRPTRHGPIRVPGEPIDFEHFEAEWKKVKQSLQNDITKSRDPSLQHQLESLEAEWSSFVAQETGADPENASQIQKNSDDLPRENSEQPKRRGRPSGSGSYEAADEPIVEEMRKILIQEPHLSPWAAAMRLAERAKGAGTLDSKAKRLAERYSAKYGNRPH